MELITVKAPSEEREEGEIVEDDLEDVSDCSMIPGSPLEFGKSVSPPEPLSAVCLSSVSSSEFSRTDDRRIGDNTFQYLEDNHGKHRVHRRKRKLTDHTSRRTDCHHIRHRRRSVIESDSDSESVDPKYARQLREALRRESAQELHNSLRTRLKGFIEPGSQSDDETNLNALRDLALRSTGKNLEIDENNLEYNDPHLAEFTNSLEIIEDDTKSVEDKVINGGQIHESIDDPELQELRIAALKSFVLENHERRKKRATIQENVDHACSGSSNKDETSDIDKENDQSVINNDTDVKTCKKIKVEKGDNNSENEIVKQENPVNTDKIDGAADATSANCVENLIEEDVDILRAMLLASMSKKLSNTEGDLASNDTSGFPKTFAGIRRVERSKTNYNSLSVTISKPSLRRIVKNDLYTNITKLKNDNEPKNEPSVSNHVVVVKPLIINVGESDSDTENNVSNTNDNTNKILKDNVTEFLKKQRAEVEASVNKKKIENSDSSLNKSDDLLMDKSVMKLLPRSQQLEYRKLKQQLLNARKRTRIRKPSQRLSESKRENVQNVRKVPKSKTDILINNNMNTSNKLTRNVQEKKIVTPTNLQKTLNGLQIRKNGRLQMKGKYRSLAPLLQKINQASNERQQHELEIKKLLLEIQKARVKLAASHQSFTDLVQQLVHQKSVIDQRTVYKLSKFSQAPVTSTPNKLIENQPSVEKNTTSVENGVPEIENAAEEKQDVNIFENKTSEVDNANHNKLQEDEVILDPNDITKVFVEQPMTFPKYTSPLDNRDGINDPLTTICPYDLLGVCKDKECRYMHCS